jgi:hypothetical protein
MGKRMMAHTTLRRLLRDRRGSASVEFLFGVLFVVILMVGFMEMGRAIHYYQAITDGVRAGGRFLTRVENPCADAAVQQALGLVVTRTSDWSEPPIFSDWPDTPTGGGGANIFNPGGLTHFEVELQGCEAGDFAAENSPENIGPWSQKVIFFVKYQYRDYLGFLEFIGLQDGFWIVGRHEEVHIGV